MLLENLRGYNNLGTPTYFWELFLKLKGENPWTVKEVADYFFNRIIDGKSSFDGCIPLLLETDIISVNQSGVIEAHHSYRNITYNPQFCRNKILEGILLALKKSPEFIEVFASDRISYDLINRTINVKFSAFGFRYANLRNLLVDFGFLELHPNLSSTLVINSAWKQFFERHFISKIRTRRMSPEDIQRQQSQQQINGEIAERFVLGFEKTRLRGKSGIEWIAPYDASAGFDILSFRYRTSKDNDLLIEVKSYVGSTPYFYWTRNEMQKARDNPDKYQIYLVDRGQIEQSDYRPVVIPNPALNVLENDEWDKEIDKYCIISLRKTT